ncbi:hypothetical protein DPEC_G00102490 [Dallia pectoralis]|uniref:Uncharacterized protein n=1 Tax=Dallia pectoralis TaxID=75939 RepID=A0ACC2GXS1_DALPE|nr:hypothetical protein DPEC_G00102490 [Dallia pectoralis]
MSNVHKTIGKYLWWSLLGLGFEPELAASSSGSGNPKHVILGPNMFDKPNKDAFYIVTHFLLEKLNPTRFHDEYRGCWPVLGHKADAQFRKLTCAWLKDLMDEQGSTVPKVMASLLLSPGGPKFINLMFHLANHVLLQEMKTCCKDSTWVPEAAAAPASSVEMAQARYRLVKTRFLRCAVEQDRLLQEYHRRAPSLVKSTRDWRAEDAKYDDLLRREAEEADPDRSRHTEKIQKVRSLWSTIDGVLSELEEKRLVLASVIRGDVDQYTLDGTGLDLKIPRVLLERLERLSHQSSVGSVYEDNQLNLLRMLELFRQALDILGEERSRVVGPTPNPHVQSLLLEERSLQMARAVDDLRLMRKRISNEIPEVKTVIRKLETEWDHKWVDCLKRTPLTSFLNEDPALDFLSPMAPLSFEPAATETCFKSSVFSQYPAKLPDVPEKKPVKMHCVSMETVTTVDSAPERCFPVEMVASPLPSTDVSSLKTPLNTLCETPIAMADKALPDQLPADLQKTTIASSKVSAVKKRAQILECEFDNLADQFADAVTASTGDSNMQGLELGDILGTLGADPFSTRKQIPRTPESLISDVKCSWRKAVKEEAQKGRLSVKIEDSILGRLTPLSEAPEVLGSPDVPSMSTSLDPSTEAPQQASLSSTLFWDSSSAEALYSLSSSDVVQCHVNQEALPEQFSLDQETLPEMSGDDGFLSSCDSSGTEEELLLPGIPLLVPGETEPALLAARRRLNEIQQAFGEASFMDCHQGALEALPPQLNRGRFLATTHETAVTDKVFSLDLEIIESPSSPIKDQHSFPELLTFSPIDKL